MNELVTRFFNNLYTGLMLGFFSFDNVGIFIPIIFAICINNKRSINYLFAILLGRNIVFLFFALFPIKYLELFINFENYNYVYIEIAFYLILLFFGIFILMIKKNKFFKFYYLIFLFFGIFIGFIPSIKYKIFLFDIILYKDNYPIRFFLSFFYSLATSFSPYIVLVYLFEFVVDIFKKASISIYVKYLLFKSIRLFCGIFIIILGFYRLYLLKFY